MDNVLRNPDTDFFRVSFGGLYSNQYIDIWERYENIYFRRRC